jgi:glycosyltransferase involved in cell wall biosynthesis
MIQGKKMIVVMPAYNAEKTLRQTFSDLPHEYVDDVILVDDASRDRTALVAKELGITTIVHSENKGYGANQKTCYREALRLGADIVVMVHPDYQYSPKLVTAMASMITSGHYDVVLASRILGGKAREGGMPLYKYVANRFLTLFENVMLGVKLSEYHSGYRAFSRTVLESLPRREPDDFVSTTRCCTGGLFRLRDREISCPTRYFEDASSIPQGYNIRSRSALISMKFALQKAGVLSLPIFNSAGETQ